MFGIVIFADLLSGGVMIQFYDTGWSRFTPRRPIPTCQWDRFDLLCVHRGDLHMRFVRRQVTVERGQAVLIYPHTRFQGDTVGPTCDASVQHFSVPPAGAAGGLPGVLRRLAGRVRGFERLAMQDPARVRHDVDRAIRAAFAVQSAGLHDQRVALLVLILSQLHPVEHGSVGRGWVLWERLDPWLRGQLHRQVSVEELASHVGLSTSRFRQRFVQVTGVSPARHLRRLRMAEAQRLLRETDEPIKRIGQRLTYGDLPNFYRAFAAVTGMTPGDYRQRHALRG
jgi:AraC-like DNA-binding protein